MTNPKELFKRELKPNYKKPTKIIVPKEEKPLNKYEVLLESFYTGLSSSIIVETESEAKMKAFIKRQYKHYKRVWFRPFGNKKYISIIDNHFLYSPHAK